MKDSAAETTGVKEGDSRTQGQGEEHSHQSAHILQSCSGGGAFTGCVHVTGNTSDEV